MDQRKREFKDFEFTRQVGEGSYSTVVLAREKDSGKMFAIKILEKSHILKHNKSKYVMQEKDLLNKLNHPGVVKLWYTFQDSYRLYFAMDFAPYGDLLNLMQLQSGSKGLPLGTCRLYGAQVVEVLEYLYSQHIIHRDLKPENLLINAKFHLVLADFGTACQVSEQAAETSAVEEERGMPQTKRSFVGTAEYCSPELLSERGAVFESDLWAFGCILYQMIHGKPPFRGYTEYMTFQRIMKLEYGFVPTFPEDASDLIKQILVTDPQKRLGASGNFGRIKSHPFFQPLHGDWNLYSEELPIDSDLKHAAKEHLNALAKDNELPFALF